MLKANGIMKVKLFDADPWPVGALLDSGIEVMLGIPNDMLADRAGSTKDAERWVTANVSKHVNDGVDIRYICFCVLFSFSSLFFLLSTSIWSKKYIPGRLTRK